MACEWDNPGFQVCRWEKEINSIYLAVDATDEVIAEAKELKADMILTHHPLIFGGIKNVLTSDFIGRRIYGADNVKDLMISGERAIAMIWSGEGLTLADEYDNLKYIVPKEGANFWIDSLVIPKGTKNKEAAEIFINFLCEKDSAYRIAEEIGYTTPHEGAMMEQDEDVRNNPGAYMPEEVMDKCESYKYLNTEELLKYEKVWLEVKS